MSQNSSQEKKTSSQTRWPGVSAPTNYTPAPNYTPVSQPPPSFTPVSSPKTSPGVSGGGSSRRTTFVAPPTNASLDPTRSAEAQEDARIAASQRLQPQPIASVEAKQPTRLFPGVSSPTNYTPATRGQILYQGNVLTNLDKTTGFTGFTSAQTGRRFSGAVYEQTVIQPPSVKKEFVSERRFADKYLEQGAKFLTAIQRGSEKSNLNVQRGSLLGSAIGVSPYNYNYRGIPMARSMGGDLAYTYAGAGFGLGAVAIESGSRFFTLGQRSAFSEQQSQNVREYFGTEGVSRLRQTYTDPKTYLEAASIALLSPVGLLARGRVRLMETGGKIQSVTIKQVERILGRSEIGSGRRVVDISPQLQSLPRTRINTVEFTSPRQDPLTTAVLGRVRVRVIEDTTRGVTRITQQGSGQKVSILLREGSDIARISSTQLKNRGLFDVSRQTTWRNVPRESVITQTQKLSRSMPYESPIKLTARSQQQLSPNIVSQYLRDTRYFKSDFLPSRPTKTPFRSVTSYLPEKQRLAFDRFLKRNPEFQPYLKSVDSTRLKFRREPSPTKTTPILSGTFKLRESLRVVSGSGRLRQSTGDIFTVQRGTRARVGYIPRSVDIIDTKLKIKPNVYEKRLKESITTENRGQSLAITEYPNIVSQFQYRRVVSGTAYVRPFRQTQRFSTGINIFDSRRAQSSLSLIPRTDLRVSRPRIQSAPPRVGSIRIPRFRSAVAPKFSVSTRTSQAALQIDKQLNVQAQSVLTVTNQLGGRKTNQIQVQRLISPPTTRVRQRMALVPVTPSPFPRSPIRLRSPVPPQIPSIPRIPFPRISGSGRARNSRRRTRREGEYTRSVAAAFLAKPPRFDRQVARATGVGVRF
jgi:hypothetical protein